jgi:hypothetical protein
MIVSSRRPHEKASAPGLRDILLDGRSSIDRFRSC